MKIVFGILLCMLGIIIPISAFILLKYGFNIYMMQALLKILILIFTSIMGICFIAMGATMLPNGVANPCEGDEID